MVALAEAEGEDACGSAALSAPTALVPGSHKQLSQVTLYLFCRQKIAYFPGSQQKKSKGRLYARSSCKVLIRAMTFSLVKTPLTSNFYCLCFVYAALDVKKMQVSVNALIKGSFMFLQG